MAADFDVAVLGAGPAGAATARWLEQSGCRVALVEQSRLESPRVGESLAPSTQPLLRDLGVWPEFMALRPLPSYGTRSIWGSPVPEQHSHLVSPYGCGWHVDRLMFDRMLVDAASAAGVDVRCGTTLLDCVFDGRDWRLQIQDSSTRQSRQLRASVAIDATGRSARLARAMGQQRIVFDRLVGVAVLSRERDPSRDGYVLVEAAPEGWWYSAPVGPDCLMTMFMTDSDLCGRARLSTLSRWRELLVDAPNTAAHIRGTEVWGPKVFSARSQRLGRRDFNAPWLGVGDAALSVDPISGSGVVRALRSARAAAAAALKLLDTPSHQTIEAYEADRDAECTTYLRERASYYGFEQRWQQFPFWWRRTATVGEDR